MEKEPYNYLMGDVNFSNTKDFQTIYASQLYGTFFGIYIRFIKTTEDQNNFYIKEAELKLLNYKGPLNLGITQVEFIKVSHNSKYKDWPPGGVFKIEAQALHGSQSFPITAEDNEYSFSKEGSYLCVDRRLKKMHPDPTPEDPDKGMPLQNGVFDDEFWYRGRFTNDLTQHFIPRENHPLEWNSPPPEPPMGYPSEWCILGINAVT